MQVGRLHDGVRVAADVDDLPDEQALRIGRPDATTQLEPGRDDLVALDDDLARVDLLHHEHAAELADDLTPRGVRDELPDDRRGAVGQQHDHGAVRPDLA